MPGDELHEEATGSAKAVPGARRERTGPRHAAPKKPFLTRLHVPAGKAVAIAAMPSAVLMSMGVTPQLAYAKPLPKNPFGDGPCVSQQDRAEEEARKEAAAEAERKAEEARKREAAERKAEEEKKEQEAAEEAESSTSGGSSGGGSDGGSSGASGASGGTDGSGSTSGGSAEPEPEPSPSGEGSGDGLLGGILGGLGDTLSGDGGEQKQTDAPAEAQPSGTPDVSAEDATDPVRDTVDDVRKDLDDTVGKVEDTVGDARDKLPDPSVDDATEQLPGAEETGPVTGEDGERAFPCVEEKKVAGTDEQTPTTLPNQPWTLKASSLTIRGQDYEGVFNVRTADGDTKQVLKFTADSVDIGDLHQIVQGPDGLKYHVKAAAGSTSTIRDGQVTLYTERLEGKLFGLIPIVFDPEHPPPLNISNVYFTDVTVQQAGQFGGTLTIPGLTSTITSG